MRRPRIVRSQGDVRKLPTSSPSSEATSLRSVEPGRAPVDSPELWAGVHIPEVTDLESKDLAPLTAKDALLLERLATKAQRFTPRVSLVPPDGLLLEVKGSLHLFNGIEGLIKELLKESGAVGLRPVIAFAPTPLASLVAARAGVPLVGAARADVPLVAPEHAGQRQQVAQPERGRQLFVVTNRAQLISSLSSLPLAPLRWPEKMLERLALMGIRTIGQVLRLPRAGFARRFGPEPLAELDRLTGRRADLRHRFQPRERFRRRRELTYELESTATLLTVLAPLLVDLGRFLQERQCGITELECRLRHRHAPATRCHLRLAAPVANVARLTELLGERLSALVLPEPVRSCEIRSGLPVRRVLASNSLWQPGEHGGSGGPESPELIERLRVRLGHESVYGLQVLQSHRPESAWGQCEPKVTGGTPASPPSPLPAFRRPLWLLPAPQQLEEVDGLPRRRGALRFVGDVERVETGWWDGSDVGRDYYTAFDTYGVQLWLFRERAQPHRWFLHGVFG